MLDSGEHYNNFAYQPANMPYALPNRATGMQSIQQPQNFESYNPFADQPKPVVRTIIKKVIIREPQQELLFGMEPVYAKTIGVLLLAIVAVSILKH